MKNDTISFKIRKRSKRIYLSIVGIGANTVVLTSRTWFGSAGAAILSRAALPMFMTEFIQLAIMN